MTLTQHRRGPLAVLALAAIAALTFTSAASAVSTQSLKRDNLRTQKAFSCEDPRQVARGTVSASFVRVDGMFRADVRAVGVVVSGLPRGRHTLQVSTEVYAKGSAPSPVRVGVRTMNVQVLVPRDGMGMRLTPAMFRFQRSVQGLGVEPKLHAMAVTRVTSRSPHRVDCTALSAVGDARGWQ